MTTKKIFKHFDGREIPIVEVVIPSDRNIQERFKFSIGEKVKIGVYGNDYVEGCVASFGLTKIGTHKFTKETLEIYLKEGMELTLSNGSTWWVCENYNYPIVSAA